ncbi:MAG: RNase adapter RapZ [Erysipelotrichaceae bacterium]|nr:RNase adapter RapZ [Erysipelotrichaceae bacterium]
MSKKRIVIVTGLSGAGKTSAMRVLEDIGYHCIDQIPAELREELYHLFLTSRSRKYQYIALAMPMQDFKAFTKTFSTGEFDLQVLFLTASEDSLLLRYKQSRKIHPQILSKQAISLEEAIRQEIEIAKEMKDSAWLDIDTTFLRNSELKRKLNDFLSIKEGPDFTVSFITFGYKKGIPQDADLVFDVRFLPNPFWVNKLKNKTGLEQDVYDYVLDNPVAKEFLKQLTGFLDFILDQFSFEGKNHFTIAIGCTGGQHRSVSVARYLYDFYLNKYQCYISHRDINNEED